jgi:membrane associated rhomboid family serine protease
VTDLTTRCYRHPDRETGVSCQRCDRYICVDCSTPGAVGFLCPEDSKDRVKIHKATFQKNIVSAAPVTFTLIGINVLVYICQFLFPELILSLYYANVGSNTEWGSWQRVFTSGFAHSENQITHILFNMYSLFVLGTLLEPMIGKWRFITLYLFSMFGGGLGYLLLSTSVGYVVGASGAVFGLMGAYLVFLVKMKLNAGQMYIIIGINLIVGFLPGIAWEAHVGGLIVGAAVGYLLISTRENAKKNLQLLGLVGIGIALVAIWIIGNAPINVLNN